MPAPASSSIDGRINALLRSLDSAARISQNAEILRICRELRRLGEDILPHVEKALFSRTYGRTILALLNLLGEMATKGCLDLLVKFSCGMNDPGEEWLVMNAIRILRETSPDRFETMVAQGKNGNDEHLLSLVARLDLASDLAAARNLRADNIFEFLKPGQIESPAAIRKVLEGECEDRVKVEAIDVISEKFPDSSQEILASFVERSSADSQWPVNKAIAQLIRNDSKDEDSKIKELARTGSESLVERILKTAMNSDSENSLEIMKIISNRFDVRHALHMRAEAALQSRERKQSAGARGALPRNDNPVGARHASPDSGTPPRAIGRLPVGARHAVPGNNPVGAKNSSPNEPERTTIKKKQ